MRCARIDLAAPFTLANVRARAGSCLRRLPALGVLLLCAACASSGAPERKDLSPLFEIAGAEIRNELVYRVTDVQVLVPGTGEFVSCGIVFPGTACSSSFPQRDYRGDPLSITWKERGEPHSVDDFVLEAPAGLDSGRPVWLQIVIFSPGNAGARLVSEPQGPR